MYFSFMAKSFIVAAPETHEDVYTYISRRDNSLFIHVSFGNDEFYVLLIRYYI